MTKKELIEALLTIVYTVNEMYEDKDIDKDLKLRAITRQGKFTIEVKREKDGR